VGAVKILADQRQFPNFGQIYFVSAKLAHKLSLTDDSLTQKFSLTDESLTQATVLSL
jgi:hypothetical protein